jgi:hypothetical protein
VYQRDERERERIILPIVVYVALGIFTRRDGRLDEERGRTIIVE